MVGATGRALILVAALAVSGIAAALWLGACSAARVYSVAAIDAGLAHDPAAWLGRPLRVQGRLIYLPVASGCSTHTPSCVSYVLEDTRDGSRRLARVPPPADGSSVDVTLQAAVSLTLSANSLIAHPGGQDGFLQALRAVPLLDRLVPGPQELGATGTYRLRLQRAPAGSLLCSTSPCYEAILLDAAPPSA